MSERTPTIAPGATSVGEYAVERSLGAGGTSELFLARDRAGRGVVVKRLYLHCALDPTVAAMFRHEGVVLAALRHPALPALYATGEQDRRPHLVLEHVDGVDLGALVRRAHAQGRALPLAAAVEALRQLLDALAYVHAYRDEGGRWWQLVHRDVSPGNVLVTRDGAVRLVDFGIATSVLREDPDRGVGKGTRGYMAPEVVTGAEDAGAAADLFGAGVILYELTTARRLYEGAPAAVMAAIVEGPVPSPADVAPGYPPALDAVVRRALAKRPAERFPSAAAMAAALLDAARVAGVAPSREALAAVAREA